MVNNEGVLLVNQKNLDRDPPNPGKFKFQVRNSHVACVIFIRYVASCNFGKNSHQIVAREKNGNAASAPVTVAVILNDVNDNAPRFANPIPTITLQAGEMRRQIVKVRNTLLLTSVVGTRMCEFS